MTTRPNVCLQPTGVFQVFNKVFNFAIACLLYIWKPNNIKIILKFLDILDVELYKSKYKCTYI